MAGKARVCPECGQPLRPWRLGDVALEGCDTCGGVWLDRGELEAATRLAGAPLEAIEAQYTPGLAAAAGGGAQECPACGKPLRPSHLHAAAEVHMSACAACGGVWLPDGALGKVAGHLPRQTRGAPSRPAVELADEVDYPDARYASSVADPAAPPHPAVQYAELPHGPYAEARPTVDAAGHQVYHRRCAPTVDWFMPWLLIFYAALRLSPAPSSPDDEFAYALPVAFGVFCVWLVRWYLKPTRVELSRDGMMFCSLFYNRFVPWESIWFGMVFDAFSPFTTVYGRYSSFTGIGPGRGYDMLGEEKQAEGGWIHVFLVTWRGPVWFGPELRGHVRLVDEVRKHM